jgi:hypothetical protein
LYIGERVIPIISKKYASNVNRQVQMTTKDESGGPLCVWEVVTISDEALAIQTLLVYLEVVEEQIEKGEAPPTTEPSATNNTRGRKIGKRNLTATIEKYFRPLYQKVGASRAAERETGEGIYTKTVDAILSKQMDKDDDEQLVVPRPAKARRAVEIPFDDSF